MSWYGGNEHEPADSPKPSPHWAARARAFFLGGPLWPLQPLRRPPFVQQIAKEWQSPKAPAGMSMTPPGPQTAEGSVGHWALFNTWLNTYRHSKKFTWLHVQLWHLSSYSSLIYLQKMSNCWLRPASLSSDRASPGSSCPQQKRSTTAPKLPCQVPAPSRAHPAWPRPDFPMLSMARGFPIPWLIMVVIFFFI